ncbi:polysaccharide chain length determinant protein (PEP-CTERM system associated) [Skermanella aerolata]|uniref:XrtA system polysaccharide chain length determinant n=1 Tax=Skermanella aerolata TaxID=393310 RepID=UPI003D21FD80
MNDLTLNMKELIRHYATELWARRWWVVGIVWLVSLAGWFVVARMPDVYASSARVYVDTQSLLNPLMKGMTVRPDIEQQIEIMRRTLISRPNMEQLIRLTDLDLTVNSEGARESLLSGLEQRIRFAGEGRQIFNIQFEDSDPKLAHSVVQSLLQIFVEQNVGDSRRDIERTRRFVDTQIADYEKRLRDSEAQVAEFRRANAEELRYKDIVNSRLQTAEFDLRQLENQLQAGTWQRDQLKTQLAGTPETLAGADPAQAAAAQASSAAGQRVEQLRQQLSEMRLRFTEQNPSVINMKRMIEQAEADARRQSGGGAAPNPMRKQLEGEIQRLDLEIASLGRRIELRNNELGELRKRQDEVPAVELQLAQMNRDYGVLRQNYDQLIERRESIRMADRLDSQTSNVDFRVVDPPLVPTRPSGPNRALLFGGVLGAAFAAALGVVFVLIQLKDSFSNPNRLREAFDVPVLGSVSMVPSPKRRRWKRAEVSALGGSVAVLLLVFGGLMMLYQPGQPKPTLSGLAASVFDQSRTGS